MSYNINKFDGTTVTVVDDGTINNTLDIKLVGKDYPGYGEIENENLVFLLENFAGNAAPPRPMNGQLWYDAVNRKIKFYDKVALKWRSSGSAEVSATAPAVGSLGDLWYDSTTKQLKVYTNEPGVNAPYTVIGPEGVKDKGITRMVSRGVYDVFNNIHAVIEAWVDGKVVYIISDNAAFTLNATEAAYYGSRFGTIRRGLNLAFSNDAVITTDTNYRYWGSASDSDRLGGRLASDYFSVYNTAFPDTGMSVGNDLDLKIFMQGVNGDANHWPVIKNTISNSIVFSVTSGSTTLTPFMIHGNTLIPGSNDLVDLGASSNKFNEVYSTYFRGVADSADKVTYNSVGISASYAATNATPTVVVRSAAGDIYSSVFHGTATAARYADLAEKYIPDADYEVGTVMVIGGEQEVTASSHVGQRAIGVISGEPGFMMNCDLHDGVYIALKGRVPVKVHGPVRKGNRLIASSNGAASACVENFHDVFAMALESSDIDGIVVIEAVIL